MRMLRIKRKPTESDHDRRRREAAEFRAKYEARKAEQKANPDSRVLTIPGSYGGKESDSVFEDWLRDGLVVGWTASRQEMGAAYRTVTIYGELVRSDLPKDIQEKACTLEQLEEADAKKAAEKAKELETAKARRDRIVARRKQATE